MDRTSLSDVNGASKDVDGCGSILVLMERSGLEMLESIDVYEAKKQQQRQFDMASEFGWIDVDTGWIRSDCSVDRNALAFRLTQP